MYVENVNLRMDKCVNKNKTYTKIIFKCHLITFIFKNTFWSWTARTCLDCKNKGLFGFIWATLQVTG